MLSLSWGSFPSWDHDLSQNQESDAQLNGPPKAHLTRNVKGTSLNGEGGGGVGGGEGDHK